MRKLFASALLALALPLAACSGGNETTTKQVEDLNPKLPLCEDVPGMAFEDWRKGCLNGRAVEMTGSVQCKDGRMIYWNAGGWAYEGGTAQPTVEGAVPGDVYWTQCQGITR